MRVVLDIWEVTTLAVAALFQELWLIPAGTNNFEPTNHSQDEPQPVQYGSLAMEISTNTALLLRLCEASLRGCGAS